MLPIELEEIKQLVKKGKINSNFPYLDDPFIMYEVIKEDITLINLINDNVKKRMLFSFCNDLTSSLSKKKELLYELIDYFQGDKFADLIDNEEYYIKLATKNTYAFVNLCNINHDYKEKELEIFTNLYEDEYSYNSEYPIVYAKASSKVLLNTLKKKSIGIYHLIWFSKEAFSQKVIDYIKENDMIDEILYPGDLYNITDLLVLKLKKHRDFIFELPDSLIDERIIQCLKEFHLTEYEIDKYIENNNKNPDCLKNEKFILYLLERDIENIKYFNGKEIKEELASYLNNKKYIFKENHNINLLSDSKIANRFIENVGNIDFILEHDVDLKDDSIEVLLEKIEGSSYKCLNMKNKYLLDNDYFLSRLINYLNINNPYNLENKYLISNLGRSLDKLSLIFSNNDIEIIKREIVENDYHIDMISVINNIDLFKLKNIYDELYKKENKFNNNFSFYFFIKIMDYLANHLTLVKELNENSITSQIIDNLALAINCSDDINYEELVNYKLVYKNKINSLNLSIEDKIYRLLINSNRGKSFIPERDTIDVFLEDIFNPYQLTYLQLEFSSDSNEYNLLENYIELSKLLYDVRNFNDEELMNVYNDLMEKFNPNTIFDTKVIRENLLRLQSRVYYKNRLNIDDLRKKGKCYIHNNCEIINITGENFILYTHDNEFHPIDDDFTSYDLSDVLKTYDMRNNYICCELASELSYDKLTISKMIVYSLNNPTSLIAFGNRDIWIKHTIKPLIQTEDCFVNQYDMAFIKEKMHAYTEFDFLRVDDQNEKLLSSYKVVKNMSEAIIYINYGSTKKILIFDEEEHQKCLISEMKSLKENISNLNYKQLYRLIALSAKFMCLECFIEEINIRISGLTEKEQFVLKDALNRYSSYIDGKKKVKTIN